MKIKCNNCLKEREREFPVDDRFDTYCPVCNFTFDSKVKDDFRAEEHRDYFDNEQRDSERQESLDNREVKEIEKKVFELSDLFLKIYE